ncbi:MAG: cyclopropane-fatty-acyl-phospholipid synthase [Planctomycetaceae bacterium]|nr:cyclopropane-fatty-acyl-phospholipid synthase [Planctomycetaceae bacterium]
MSDKTIWQTFFDVHAPIYEQNVFTKNTTAEVYFLLQVLDLPPRGTILDVGCGTGRHAIELAQRGYAVAGLDLSQGMLAVAAENAAAAGVHVEWVHADATNFSFPHSFDAAIGLCKGAFGLLSRTDDPIDQPLSILCNISRCLKPHATAVLTVLNAAAMLRRYQNADIAAGNFDPLTMTESSTLAPREGQPAVPTRERAFVPTELTLLFRLAGLSVHHLGGGTAGNWGHRPIDLDEIEIMIIASKTADPSPVSAAR